VGIRGDFEKLRNLKRKVGDPGAFRERVLKAAAAEARTQIALEFRQSVDPSGQPWAPLKHRRGQPLRLTGRLANSFTSEVTAKGFRVGTNVSYAVFHQQGTKGHKAHQRFQAVGKKGRFVSRKSRSGSSAKKTSVRMLNFREGGGVIPKRQMIPEGTLPPRWSKPIDTAMRNAAERFFKTTE
jgi:phage gpG-like protein